MSEHFGDRMQALCAARGAICAGADPRSSQLPPGVDAAAWAETLGALLGGEVAALKPQLAFFGDAWEGPERLARAARPGGALVVADAKRGDIGSTAEAYAARLLGPESPFDALTVNPYLGRDALEPFVEAAAANGKGIFVLVRTSNPGFADIQDLRTEDGERVCERVARLVHELGRDHLGQGGLSCVGAVVGLTAPAPVVRQMRDLMPDAPFLMPGYGAQGGDPACYQAALDARGGGVLVSASRSLTHPWKGPAPDDWRELVLAALQRMQGDLGEATGQIRRA